MNNLLSVRTNILYTKAKEEDAEYIKHNEIILLIEEPVYSLSNQSEVIRNHGLKEFRFTVQNDNLQNLIDYLTELKECKEKDLK